MRALFASVASMALIATAPALAADYLLRPSYSDDWSTTPENPLRIETGIRYWYSIGEQDHSIGGFTESMETKTSSGELFARIDDLSTQSYLEATGGYGIAHSGSSSTNGGPSVDLDAARLGYVGADYGWMPFGNESASFGFMTGYQYTNDSPDTGRANFFSSPEVVPDGDGGFEIGGGQDSEINNFDVHSLRLGLAGKVDMGSFDILGEAAAIPYSWVSGTYGAFAVPGIAQASATNVNGHGYGAAGKLMVGFHPTENLTIRIGGRASYLEGQYDATWDGVSLVPSDDPDGEPTLSRQTYISNNNPFSMLRYGALLEVAGRF